MFYTLQVTVETERDIPVAAHRPISIETFTLRKEDITAEELDMVAEAFKRQIRGLLEIMV